MGNLRPMVPKGKLYLSDHKTVRLLYLCDRVPGGRSQQCQILFQQWRRTPFHFQQLQALTPQLTISFEHFQFLKVWKNTTSVVFLRMVSFPALIDSLALRDMRWESNFFVVPHNWNTLECNDWTYISLTSANSKYYLTRLYYFFPDGDIISFIFQLGKLRQRVTQLEVDQPPYAEGDPICTNVRTDRPFEGRKYVIFFGESPHFLAGCSEFKSSEASPR